MSAIRRESDRPLLSITVPCFHQLELARASVDSILTQSFSDFELTLLDDGNSDDYRVHFESLGDRRLRYRRNPERLGAMRNMFKAIYHGSGTYSMGFHEDDLLGKHYLETAVAFLERTPDCGFVAAELSFFESERLRQDGEYRPATPRFDRFDSGAEFLRSVFSGIEPMFGSVIYRRAALESVRPSIDELETLCDRPFLLHILKDWSAALLREPLAFCRMHGPGDRRHDSLTEEQVLRFFQIYRAQFPRKLNPEDRRLFRSYCDRWLPDLHRLIPDGRRPPLPGLLFRAWREGLFDPWRFAARRILKSVRA
jgi:glycosyltransferase involved in cell wall biosynthesis